MLTGLEQILSCPVLSCPVRPCPVLSTPTLRPAGFSTAQRGPESGKGVGCAHIWPDAEPLLQSSGLGASTLATAASSRVVSLSTHKTTDSMSHDTPTPTAEEQFETNSMSSIRTTLTQQQFADFHQKKERERNAEEGYDDTRNDPAHMAADEDHSPSNILNCHRMSYYKSRNAPREDALPFGIFKFGHDFEAYVQTFIEDEVAPEDSEVRNVEQIDFTVDGLHFTGSTDPVIFNADGVPTALFEVKSTGSLYHVKDKGVNERHKAQAHAYAKGLARKYNRESPPPIFFIYGDRETLEVAMIEIEFDPEFWEDEVMEWAHTDTEYRRQDELPPTIDDPESTDNHYMCGYCDYAERCGNYTPESVSPHSDEYTHPGEIDEYWWNDTIATSIQNTTDKLGPKGFLPLTQYPEATVISQLVTYPETCLTPTLAHQYPALVAESARSGQEDESESEHDQTTQHQQERLNRLYGASPTREVNDWVCQTCWGSFRYDRFEWDGEFDSLPSCPDCRDDPTLRGRKPGELLL